MIVDLHFFFLDSGHVEKFDHLLVVWYLFIEGYQFLKVIWILGLNKSIDGILKLLPFEEAQSEFGPNFTLIDFLSIFLSSFN